jgi:glycosyltransferase involved in cell wall biosynthesis/SAM-dependent methyltransferase
LNALRPLRIGHVIPSDGIGGVEVAAREAAVQRPDLVPVFVAGAAAPGSGGLRSTLRTLRVLFGFDALWRLRRARCDVAVFSLWKTGLLFLAWRLLLRRPAILFLHCERSVHRLDDWLTRACARHADGILADSAATARQRLPPSPQPRAPLRVVSLLAPAAPPAPATARDPARLVYWGRLSAVKRLDRCLRLVARLRAAIPEASFDLIGPDDGEGERLRALAAELGLGEAVRFHPPAPRAEVFARVADATWFLQASEYEGFCMGVAEAMQQGLVPVVTPVGEIARYSRDGHDAVWIGAGEAGDAAAAAEIARLVRDPEGRARMSIAAREAWAGRPAYADDFPAAVAELLGAAATTQAGTTPAPNRDDTTITSFGAEWSRFDQTKLESDEQCRIFAEYFAIFPWAQLPPDAEGADIGSGSGRWARLVHPRVGRLHCVDPSPEALAVSQRALAGAANVRFHCASVDALPFADGSLDFCFSLGVLHHVPDTAGALAACARTLKPGAPMLVYLYYALDGRPAWFRALWRVADALRGVISRLPEWAKGLVTDAIALGAYWPLARLAAGLERLGADVGGLPLAYYRHHSFYTMRTDARDRFGTPLERRFSLAQIVAMMRAAGLRDVRHSPAPPYWCVVGTRAPTA